MFSFHTSLPDDCLIDPISDSLLKVLGTQNLLQTFPTLSLLPESKLMGKKKNPQALLIWPTLTFPPWCHPHKAMGWLSLITCYMKSTPRLQCSNVLADDRQYVGMEISMRRQYLMGAYWSDMTRVMWQSRDTHNQPFKSTTMSLNLRPQCTVGKCTWVCVWLDELCYYLDRLSFRVDNKPPYASTCAWTKLSSLICKFSSNMFNIKKQ